MRLLENFADNIPPQHPTVGVTWYDTVTRTLRVCTSVTPLIWKVMHGNEITGGGNSFDIPLNPIVGDIWYQPSSATIDINLDPTPGVLYIYTGLGRYPQAADVIGGWSQLWPHIEIIGGREEYDFVFDLIAKLIDNSKGGSGAGGKIITNLSLLEDLDADFYTKWVDLGQDPSALTPITAQNSEFTIDPNSNDWDVLLAAGKYAVARLDFPAGLADDVSSIPFVTDGWPAPISLSKLPVDDIRYPTLQRRSNRRYGMVTLIRTYAETLNVLHAAVRNRYSLKGISGASGANSSFEPHVTITPHAGFTGPLGSSASAGVKLRFNFPNTEGSGAFLRGGGAIQIKLLHSLGADPTASDSDLKTLTEKMGVIRITADLVRIFSQTIPYSFSSQPLEMGFLTGASGASFSFSKSFNDVSYTVIGVNNDSNLQLEIAVNSTSLAPLMNGNLTLSFAIIRDTSTYEAPTGVTPLFPAPTSFTAMDKLSGSSFLT